MQFGSRRIIFGVTGIVAVKVTDCLYVDGFTDELSNTSATVSVIVFDVLGL